MSRNSALTARARRYLTDALHAFDHAPVEVTLSVALAAAFSYAVSSDAEPFREWLELAIVILLAGAVAFSATLLHALGAWSMRTRWVITAVGAAIAALYGAFILDFQLASEGWRAGALVIAAVLLILTAPAFGRRADATERFRLVAGRLLLRTFAVLLYAAALYGGLALALGAVNTLFELRLDAKIYAHTFGWVFFVLVTWVIVGGVPDYVRPGRDAGPVATAVHRISAFLVTPLLAIYYLILYAYAIRIALTGELPKNLVSPLVIAAGLIAGVALMLFDRQRPNDIPSATDRALPAAGGTGDVEEPAGAERDAVHAPGLFGTLRIVVPLFVPLCVLGIWTISIRLGQYGWTEFRGMRMVLLFALGALAVAASVNVVRRRNLPLYVLPLALALVAILSVVGPWSVIAGSRRSQQARLAEAMGDAGIEWNATTVRDTLIANEPHREITEAAGYLLSHFGADALPPLFAHHADSGERHVDVVYAAGLRPIRPELATSRGGYGQLESGAVIDEGPGGTLYYVRLDLPIRPAGAGGHSHQRGAGSSVDSLRAGAVANSLTGSITLRIPLAGMVLFADLGPVGRSLLNAPPGGPAMSPDVARTVLHDESGRERGELFVLEIGLGGDGTVEVHRLVGIVRLVDGLPAR
ncbi:MAG: DUF4153 domain-containing protein [Gemmatimonadetes bacterium]|nr:DUF4153 domain-containing protein [Gemmatimonadota bacterium]